MKTLNNIFPIGTKVWVPRLKAWAVIMAHVNIDDGKDLKRQGPRYEAHVSGHGLYSLSSLELTLAK